MTRQLGEGTFGRVVEGEKKGRRYAIKVLLSNPDNQTCLEIRVVS